MINSQKDFEKASLYSQDWGPEATFLKQIIDAMLKVLDNDKSVQYSSVRIMTNKFY